MRQIFELWSPRFPADDALALDVTAANLPEIHQPPREWIDGCLAAAGVKAGAREWHVRPSWCSYYSGFPRSADWQDRWRITWTIAVTLAVPARRPSALSALPAWYDRHDPSWKMDDEDDRREAGTLLFAALGDAAGSVAGEVERVADELRGLGGRYLEPSVYAYDDGWTEGRIGFSGIDFQADVASLDAIVERLGRAGFATNWRQVMEARLP
ncbi:MAG TPA: hypothetical protein VM759_01730 [Longimicrobium sp.]|nr:hypothetical protein [Longimicrobium sp.]